MTRTLMIMAGGTGGHIYPALSVADYLRDRGWRIVWLGAKTGMEARIVPERGYPMAWVRFSGLRGKGLLRMALLPFNLLVAFVQGLRAIFAHRPDVVLGMGGYVAFPGGMMAALLARPLVIHEQNSVAGLTNKVLAGVADRVLTGFPDALRKSQWTGNPVRADIAALEAPATRYAGRTGPLKLLVIGGSLGAQALNTIVPRALGLLPAAQRPQVVHQAGAAHIDTLKANYAAAGVAADARAFIDDMAASYADADLVICRAGASTIAEIAVAGVAALFVPYPHAVDDHQTVNARFLADRGGALYVPQAELTPEKLVELLKSLDRPRLAAMAEAARGAGKPEATASVAQVCMELAR